MNKLNMQYIVDAVVDRNILLSRYYHTQKRYYENYEKKGIPSSSPDRKTAKKGVDLSLRSFYSQDEVVNAIAYALDMNWEQRDRLDGVARAVFRWKDERNWEEELPISIYDSVEKYVFGK